MERRAAGVLVLAATLVLVFMCTVAAASPPGPRLAVVKLRETEWTQLLTVDSLGGAGESLYALSAWEATRAVYPFSAPSWSPDGTMIAFTTVDERDYVFGETGTSLAWISADGGAVKPIAETKNGFDPVFSPDGHTVAFAKQREFEIPGRRARFISVSIWLADLTTGRSTPLTPWRDHVFLHPSSFSPDGSRLAITRKVGDGPSAAVEIGLDGKPIRVLAPNAYEPVYSPDGQSIAFLRGPMKEVTRHFPKNHGRLRISARLTNIFVRSSLGGGLRRVTHTKRAAEGAPRWDPSGQRLAYTDWRPFDHGSESGRRQEAAGLGFGKSVRVINADGTCSRTILSGKLSMHYAATWQPGPGREAARIEC